MGKRLSDWDLKIVYQFPGEWKTNSGILISKSSSLVILGLINAVIKFRLWVVTDRISICLSRI